MVDSLGQVKKRVVPPFGRVVLAVGFVVVFVAALAPEGARAARLFTSGFETNDFLKTEWSSHAGSINNPTIVTISPRSGTYRLDSSSLSSGASHVYRNLSSTKTSGTAFTRFYFRTNTVAPSANAVIFQEQANSGSAATRIFLLTTGRFRLNNNVTGTNTDSTFNLSTNTWYRLEVRHLLADSGGEIELRIYVGDNTTAADTLSITGEDTLPVDILSFFFGKSSAVTGIYSYDDIAINDDTGSFQNSWPGPGRVALVKPTFDKSVVWTPTPAGSNAANVDDEPGTPDDDATYNAAAGSATDRFHLSDFPTIMPPTATLTLAHVFGRARVSSGTFSATFRWWNEQDAQFTGPAFSFGTSYEIPDTNELLVVDLSTSTRSEVMRSQIGYGRGPGVVNLFMTALWANVEYTGEIPGGTEVTSRSDILADSRPSASSNHTISFKTNNAITASSTVEIRFPGDFWFSGGLNCGDVDAATSVQFILSTTSVGCEVTATNWGISFAPSPPTLIITAPTSTGVYVATGTVVTIKIGSNATSQQQGDSWVTNPSTAGTYTISVGGTFGGSGNMLLSILSGVTVEARVAEHLSVAIRGVPNWYNAAWGYRERITIDRNKVSGSATSFPVLVNTTDPDWRHTAWGGHVGSVTGFDFVFTDRDGLSKLDHEIEKYASTTGEFVSWVRAPFLSATSDTIVYLYYGNAGASDQQNVTGVWDTDFIGVWHLDEGISNGGTYDDSALSSNDLTLTDTDGDVSTNAAGQMDGAVVFNGVDADYAACSDASCGGTSGTKLDMGTRDFTVSAWVRPDSGGTEGSFSGMFAISKIGATEDGWFVGISGNKLHCGVRQGGAGLTTGCTLDGVIIATSTWAHITVTFDRNGNMTRYVNGAQTGTQDDIADRSGSIDHPFNFCIGGRDVDGTGCTSRLYKGAADEIRVSSLLRSSTWIGTEYNNQSSPQTFYTLGSEEAQAQIACSADDGATVSVVNTTETQVAFGNISANTFYQGCQDIEVSTNAGGGYVATVREESALRTGGGATIPDTSCDAGCDEITGGTWTNPANVGFGHTCRNQTGSDCNLEYGDGTKFRRFPSVIGGTAGSAVKVATGSFTGNGTARTISHGLGVAPKVVMLWLDEDAETAGYVLRTDQHISATSIQFPTGSGNSRLAADMITGMNSTTFSLGTASSVNETSSSYQWIAYAGTGVATGSYDGNGVDDRNVPHGLGTTPKMLFVWPDTNNITTGMCARTDRYSGDISHCWRLGTLNTDRSANKIQAMDGTNFQLGTDSHVNANGTAYKWFALAGPSVQTGSYTGNSIDDRDIPHGLSATPSMAFVWADSDNGVNGPIVRSNQHVGDISIHFFGATFPSGRGAEKIQAMSATSFQVGGVGSINFSGSPYQWFAVKSSSQFSEVAGETLMASSTPVRIAVGRVKYRLTIPGNQAAGGYTTKITYIFTPTY